MTDDIKTPPCNYEAEQAVLGSVMLDPQSDSVQKSLSLLSPEMFYNRQHGRIFESLQSLNAKGKAMDLLTLSDALEVKGELENVGGFASLPETSKTPPACTTQTSSKIKPLNAWQSPRLRRCLRCFTRVPG